MDVINCPDCQECYNAVMNNHMLKNPPFALRIETKGGTNDY